MAEVSTYPTLVASAIDRTADFLYLRDATGPSGKKVTPQAIFDANLQGSHTLLGNLTLDGGGTRSLTLQNFTGVSINALTTQGTLKFNTAAIVAQEVIFGAPVTLLDPATGEADFGYMSERYAVQAVETVTASRSLAADDSGKTLYCTNTANITLTVGVTPIGWWVRIVQGTSTGKVTIAGSGVTVSGKQGQLSTGGQWHYIRCMRLSATQYVVIGDTAN